MARQSKDGIIDNTNINTTVTPTDSIQYTALSFAKDSMKTGKESKETDDNKPVSFGAGNNYPAYLLELYGKSPIHSNVIRTKKTYIIGDGLYIKGANEKINFKVNANDTVNEFIEKITLDLLLFNSFYVEVIYDVLTNQPIEYHHVPAHKIRTNRSKSKFFYNDQWGYNSSNLVTFPRWVKGKSEGESRIFCFDGYEPSLNDVYSIPDYSSAIQAILTDIAIRQFHFTNIKTSFSASKIITFFSGMNTPDEDKKKVIQQIEAAYSGESGQKTIVGFQSPDSSKPEVQNIADDAWDKKFEVLRNDTESDIHKGHMINSQLLMGTKTAGQLGGGTEMETAFEIFRNTYVKNIRLQITTALNSLFSENSELGEVEFKDTTDLFSKRISESTLIQICTQNELRIKAGLQPIAGGDVLIGESAPAAPSRFSEEKIEYHQLSVDDFEKVKHIGTLKNEFQILGLIDESFSAKEVELMFDENSDILDFLIKNDIKNQSINELKILIKKELGISITPDDLRNRLKEMHTAGLINIKDVNDKISATPKDTADLPKSRKAEVMYSYEKRAEAEGESKIATTRAFCEKLVDNDRLYTRSEISQMSDLLGINVFLHGGGWWFNSATQTLNKHCRHYFNAVSVIRK